MLLVRQPEEYRRLSANAQARAREFTWERAARRHLDAFEPLWQGDRPRLTVERMLRHGWFDLVPETAWQTHADEIAAAALDYGDAEAYRRCRPLTAAATEELFTRAWLRADFARCARTGRGAVARQAHGEV